MDESGKMLGGQRWPELAARRVGWAPRRPQELTTRAEPAGGWVAGSEASRALGLGS